MAPCSATKDSEWLPWTEWSPSGRTRRVLRPHPAAIAPVTSWGKGRQGAVRIKVGLNPSLSGLPPPHRSVWEALPGIAVQAEAESDLLQQLELREDTAANHGILSGYRGHGTPHASLS